MTNTIRLLLIDDDELDRMMVVRALKQSKIQFEIHQSASAIEGLKMVAAERYDAILLDYMLPDMDGIDVLKTLRSGDFKNVAIIMLSNQEDPAVVEDCLEAGAQDFMLKDEVNERRLTRSISLAKQRYVIEAALRSSHEQLRVLSERDPLTGLANRRGFDVALSSSLSNARRTNKKLGVLLLDLDDFKNVNDTMGHAAGDTVLVEVARRMRMVVRDGDFLCRLGGDEFVVIARNLDRDEQASQLAERLIGVFQEPINLSPHQLVVTTSIGIAVLDDSTDNGADLLKNADVAMYRAKTNGRNKYHFYSEKLHNAVMHLTNLKRELQKALMNEEFEVYYQPQFRAASKTLCGMEAFVRWNHPRLGLLPPADFITIAEESGLLVEISNWVLQESCRQLKDWLTRFPTLDEDLTVTVNLSTAQLVNQSLVTQVESALSNNHLDSRRLELEITEDMLEEDQKAVVSTLSTLALSNINLSLDDFGLGHSSMLNLKLFPIKVLKIDRRFVSAIRSGIESDRLLGAMINFMHSLNMKVVAEGVETSEQADFCSSNGCDVLQGYYYSEPVPAKEFEMSFLAPTASKNRVKEKEME